MLFDLIDGYDKEKIQFLKDLWEKIILNISKDVDPKKILSFLSKCGILSIDEKDKKVFFGVPNEFVESQVKKFFKKSLNQAIQTEYNIQYKTEIIVFPKFHSGKHKLQTNIKKLLGIQEKQIEKKLDASTKKTLMGMFGVLFESKYRFDNFIVGGNNQLAFSAASQIAQKPGLVYNPFFIYGNVGLGKTHLLQAIANQIINTFPEKVVVYLPTTKMIDEIIEAVRKNCLSNFMKKLEEVDVLILDDVQFLAEKEKTQEIFHNIFNDFHSKKKQIILSSDRPPKELTLLESRLRSRFALGLVADIKKPDYETRVAILQDKLKQQGEEFDIDFLDMIAKNIVNNIRELEGALNILLTKQNLLGKEIEEEDVIETLQTLGYSPDKKEKFAYEKIQDAGNKNIRSKNSFAQIVEFIGNYYNISVYDLKGDSRKNIERV